jgi:hypothetical protein
MRREKLIKKLRYLIPVCEYYWISFGEKNSSSGEKRIINKRYPKFN